jgi:hypothetical protein
MTAKISHKSFAPFVVEAKVDSSQPLTEEDRRELRRLYALEGLLAIRGLNLSAFPTRLR